MRKMPFAESKNQPPILSEKTDRDKKLSAKIPTAARVGYVADRTDCALLNNLQVSGRITNAELAERVNLSPSAVLRRVQLLEENGVIQDYIARLNPQKLGYQGSVFVHVTLTSQSREALEQFEQAICNVPQIMECYLIAGESDYLLRVLAGNISDYEYFHLETLTGLPFVARIQSLFTLKTVLHKTAIPIFHDDV